MLEGNNVVSFGQSVMTIRSIYETTRQPPEL